MTEVDVECILVRAHEVHPDERPRIISDNGPQFIAKDFKEFIRLTGTPGQRHAGEDVKILAARKVVYERARCRNPARWGKGTRAWGRPSKVVLNPASQARAAKV